MVLADDLTGAAELAGTAIRYGLPARVLTKPSEPVEGVVTCYDTGTRSLSEAEARQRIAVFARAALSNHHWCYKKTDSLLRGHPRVEIESLMQLTGHTQSLLCPANPRRGRTIIQGQYFMDGRPLTEHPVAQDPEYPRLANDVCTLLGESSAIEIPDVVEPAVLIDLVDRINANVLPAGGEELFAALLQADGHCPSPRNVTEVPRPWLFVNGSHSAWQKLHETETLQREFPWVTIDQFQGQNMTSILSRQDRVMLAIGDNSTATPGALLTTLIEQAWQVLDNNNLGTVFLEGGATARAFVDRCGWARFDVLGELEPGCVALQPQTARAPVIVVKPGSYRWPNAMGAHNYSTTMV